MTVLCDDDIRRRVERGFLVDSDRSRAPVRADQFQPASLDVRLGPELYDFQTDELSHHTDTVVLRPNVPYLGHTVDYVSLPDDVVATLAGRSSVGRRFVIVHMTAGIVDPGFEGELTLEMYNFSGRPQSFSVGDRIAQLLFERMDDSSDSPYDGSYQGQTGVTLSSDRGV